MKPVYRKRLVRAVLILLPLLVVLGLLLYVKLTGFKRALEELVRSETKGQYALTIGNSSINISDLSFTFDNLSIRRTPGTQKSISVVNIPYLHVRFGSVTAMLEIRQFDIEHLIVQEPTVEIDAFDEGDVAPKENVTWSREIVQLHPAVESLLSNFDIKSLAVIRASVGMNKSGISLMRLSLIDLLVEQWNVQKLTPSSQLQLKIGGQDLNFGKAALNFSGIEFNFKQHYLTFSDFEFSSRDSISSSNVMVSGKSLVLRQLDYKDLYENNRYAIKRAEVNNPFVKANLKLKKRNIRVDDSDVLTRLLKHAFGECSVDSTIIRDARVHIVLQQDSDSVQVDLSRVNFKLHSFKVLADSNTFQVGGIEVDLHRTAIALKKDMSLHCDRIFFDVHRNLSFTQVMFFDSVKRETMARCEKLSLRNFNLQNFIFYKNVIANTVSLENGYVKITDGLERHLLTQGKFKGIGDVAIQNVSLQNVVLRYADLERSISADQLTILLNNVRRDTSGGFQYTLDNVHLRTASLYDVALGLKSQIRNLDFNGESISLKEINVHKDSLDIEIRDFVAQRSGDGQMQKNYRHWKTASMGSVHIKGRVPISKGGSAAKQPEANILIGELNVNKLAVSVAENNANLSFTGSDIKVSSIGSSVGKWTYSDISGSLSDVLFRLPSFSARVDSVSVQYPSEIHAAKIDILKDDISINLPSTSFRAIKHEENEWAVKNIYTSKPMIVMNGRTLLIADSIHVAGTTFRPQSQPLIHTIEIFKPEVSLIKTGKKHKEVKKSEAFPLPEHLIIHAGTAHLPNDKKIAFGKIQGSIARETLTCDFVRSETEKMHVELNNISMKSTQLMIDSVGIISKAQWFKTNQLEDDLIKAKISNIQINGFSGGHFLKSNSAENLDVVVGHFELDVKRDKRLTDPPVTEKPTTLEGLLKFPKGFDVNSISMLDGELCYTETSEKTSADGVVILKDISALVEFDTARSISHVKNMKAEAKLYNAGDLDFQYATLDSSSFKLAISLKEFDLTTLNQAVVPLQSLQFKSGYLIKYNLDVIADREKASGEATITYRNLHLEIFKPTEPEKKTLGTELLTLLADGIILRHSKKNAIAPVEQRRIKHKSVFNYWVKSAVHGAMGAIRKGKSKKRA